jgi:hypothetical protein
MRNIYIFLKKYIYLQMNDIKKKKKKKKKKLKLHNSL